MSSSWKSRRAARPAVVVRRTDAYALSAGTRSSTSARRSSWPIDVGHAAHRIGRIGALRAPPRDHVEVRRQAPRVHALEHVVLQHEMPRVCPVVRDLVGGVVPERVGHVPGRRGVGTHRIHGGVVACLHAAGDRRAREPIHRTAVDVPLCRGHVVRPTAVDQRGVVVRAHATGDAGDRDADGRDTVAHRDPVGSGEGPEIVVERAVLLHHHDHVLDLRDAVGAVHGGRGPGLELAGRVDTGAAVSAARTGDRHQREHRRERDRRAVPGPHAADAAHAAARFGSATQTSRPRTGARAVRPS